MRVSDTVVQARSTLSERTVTAGHEVLSGRRRGLRSIAPFVGPAVIASVAYVDPGNFATNIQAGAQYGYTLLWVVVVANVVAMLFQALSAKLGIVTGKSLATLCRETLPRPLVIAMWLASEVAAMATDLAEFLGAAIGLSLLFGVPLFAALVLTGIGTYAMLLMQRAGFRPLEYLIGGFVAIIAVCYIVELFFARPDWGSFAYHSVVPQLTDAGAITLAVGIVGATVMPHAIYLHSSLTHMRVPVRTDRDRRKIIGYSNREVIVALGLAGLVNMAMLAVAAAVFHGAHDDIAEIETAYRTLTPLLGGAAAAVFMASLLASGFSSSVVGTMAGQVIMQDFVRIRIPLWVRRVVTMLPAFVVVALGAGATQALIMSQVVLSLVLPIPMIALVWLTGRRDVMGDFVSGRIVRLGSIAACVVVLSLNALLLAQQAGVDIPFLG
jgi:manganese transport protein